jgi:Trk K+ transport system NAD-binding subunit/Kef-type K+ transport system membrane component KefB
MNPEILTILARFVLVALGAWQMGKFFSGLGLPTITGYLFVGTVASPFVLGIFDANTPQQLIFLDHIALGIIAFIAGSELHLQEISKRLRGILLNTLGIVIVAFSLLGVALYILQSQLAFSAGYPPSSRIAISLLGGTILLALSPPSTIAVIQEVRAKGAFSKMVLSITVVMDVAIVLLFALAVAFAGTLLKGESITLGFLGMLLLDIALALAGGYGLGRGLGVVLGSPLPRLLKGLVILLAGYLVFSGAGEIKRWVLEAVGLHIKIESLLVCLVAGFTVTNFTRQHKPFEELLQLLSPLVYVAFFTLTGVGLKLDVFVSTLGIALVLFAVRAVSILIGTSIGGTLANEPTRFRQYAALGLITQAGIAFGLTRETVNLFPDTLGGEFATLIISVIVLNEIFGPIFLRYALFRVGEAFIPPGSQTAEPRRLLVLGIEPQSISLARQMAARGWRVTLADTDAERVVSVTDKSLDTRHMASLNEATLAEILQTPRDALVAMLDNDESNRQVCQVAKDALGIQAVVVRLRDVRLREAFTQLGARVIDPSSAVVHLLQQSIEAPEAVDLLLQQNPDHEITQITITESSLFGLSLRDLRLPSDVLILEIIRDGSSIVPHGFSVLRADDKLTVIGSPTSLADVSTRLT